MGVEIEKKFLVRKDLWRQVVASGTLYQQGYMLTDAAKTIRIRVIEGESGYITIKGKTTGFSRDEYEYSIPQNEAEEMLQKFCEALVEKKRYKVKVADKTWEVDEFLGDNEGLIVAEVELTDESETFDLPEWVEKDVTDDKRYYNSYLSTHPYKNWNLEKA